MALSADEARAWLAGLIEARPETVEAPRRPGYHRGIDVMDPRTLTLSMHVALERFLACHGRLPDLVRAPEHNDHFFAMKFFGFIPEPNPADKLNTGAYVPAALADGVRVLPKAHVGTEPALPPDDAVPPGRYFLKHALGAKQHLALAWPPSPEQRRAAEAAIAGWFAVPYGVAWGEWWYGWGPRRWFLEPDISDEMRHRPVWALFVRRGRPAFGMVLQRYDYTEPEDLSANYQRLFDGALRPVEGTTAGRRLWTDPLPDRAARYFELAARIGRPFDIVRVDLWDTDDGGPPVLAELTLCDYNAQRRYAPEETNARVTELLFGGALPGGRRPGRSV